MSSLWYRTSVHARKFVLIRGYLCDRRDPLFLFGDFGDWCSQSIVVRVAVNRHRLKQFCLSKYTTIARLWSDVYTKNISSIQDPQSITMILYKCSRILIILLLVFPINLLCFTMWPPVNLTHIEYGLFFSPPCLKNRSANGVLAGNCTSHSQAQSTTFCEVFTSFDTLADECSSARTDLGPGYSLTPLSLPWSYASSLKVPSTTQPLQLLHASNWRFT